MLRDGVCSVKNPRFEVLTTCLQHFRSNNIAILLKLAPATAISGVLEKIKTYFVLALVDADTKAGNRGRCNLRVVDCHIHAFFSFLDIDPQDITPRWPPSPTSLVVQDGVYEVIAVPLTSISLVTGRSIRVSGLSF